MKKKIILPIVILILLSGGAYKLLKEKFSPLIYSGTIEATQIDLSSQVASRIEKFNVEEGQLISEKQLLIKLACEDIKVSFNQASKDFIRSRKLRLEGSISQENFEHTQNRFDDFKVKNSWCDIVSPITGTVLHTYKERGEFVMPGQKLLTLADLSKLWSYIYLSANDLKFVQIGKVFNAYLPQLDKKLKVKVVLINSDAEFTPKNVQTRDERERLVYGIKVQLLSDEKIFPGMNLEVTLHD